MTKYCIQRMGSFYRLEPLPRTFEMELFNTAPAFSISFFVRAAVTQIRMLQTEGRKSVSCVKKRDEGEKEWKRRDAPRPQVRLLLRPVPLHRRQQHTILRRQVHDLLQQLLLLLPRRLNLHPLLNFARNPPDRNPATDPSRSVQRRRVADVRVRPGAGDSSSLSAGLSLVHRLNDGRTNGEVNDGGDFGGGNLDRGERVEDGADGADVAGKKGERVARVGGGEGKGEEGDRFRSGDGEERREGGGEDETGGVDAL
jgi:hypothetical protein